MTLTDFEGAAVTVGGDTVDRFDDWDVEDAGGDVLSLVTHADYSASISTADLIGMGDLYDVVLNNARPGFEAETINFSTDPGTLSPLSLLNLCQETTGQPTCLICWLPTIMMLLSQMKIHRSTMPWERGCWDPLVSTVIQMMVWGWWNGAVRPPC